MKKIEREKMKKISLILVVILALAMALSACGLVSPKDLASPPSKDSTDITEDNVQTDKPGTRPIRGQWDGDTYTNTFLGLTFAKPSSWVAGNDAELQSELDFDGAGFSAPGEPFSDVMMEQDVIFDMMATDPINFSSIIVNLENLKVTDIFNGATTDEAKYLEIVKPQLTAALGVDTKFSEVTSVTIAGQEWKRMDASITFEGIDMTQSYVVRKVDNFMAILMITQTPLSDTVDEMIAFFS